MQIKPLPILIVIAGLWGLYAAIMAAPYFSASLWMDEVYSASVSSVTAPDRWDVIRSDVHPPAHPLYLSLVQAVFGGVDPHLLRLSNLLGLVFFAFAFVRLFRVWGAAAGTLALILMIGNNFTIGYLGELRAYFILLSLSFWLVVLALIEPDARSDRSARFVAFGLAALHFFGTALACSVIVVRCVELWRGGDRAGARAYAIALIAIVAATGLWIFQALSTYQNILNNGFWVEISTYTYLKPLEFSSIALLFLALLVLVALWRRKLPMRLWVLIVPLGLVLLGTALISLVEPVVTVRNLIVLVPFVTLAPVMIWRHLGQPVWPLAFLFVLSAQLVWVANQNLRPAQDYDFIAAQTFTAECEGMPFVAPQDWQPFVGVPRAYDLPLRPLGSIKDVANARMDFPACDVAGFYVATDKDPDTVVTEFATAGLRVTLESSPRSDVPSSGRGLVFRIVD